ILRGQSQLLEDVTALEDLERIRQLFAVLETKDALIKLLDLAGGAEGVQIFIGAENELFGLAGCSMVIAPYSNSQQQIVGAIGVIGPTRIDYARIIPMVDYTAKVIGRLVG
ncbi:MAG TPA: heat-inducible transcriptional repressor HrcA, partial [Thiotrichales bacterium]|nr:heat-inducible transcriptional repressor HrcA [Thiotrichales bacterium]